MLFGVLFDVQPDKIVDGHPAVGPSQPEQVPVFQGDGIECPHHHPAMNLFTEQTEKAPVTMIWFDGETQMVEHFFRRIAALL